MSVTRKGEKTASQSKRKPQRVPSAASLNRRLRNSEKKRATILDAALSTFSQYGLHGASIELADSPLGGLQVSVHLPRQPVAE